MITCHADHGFDPGAGIRTHHGVFSIQISGYGGFGNTGSLGTIRDGDVLFAAVWLHNISFPTQRW